ncbi:MAG: 2-C-methyl-D-erythritol 2,4-cyclodiphosphate synthase [Candidatus Omnitrophica bacterium]|nr:2-C-methyl-D-erythritol 2,4-cyclodiphosphate synthase [Candidatus Omnitrophota bacterium]
MEQYKVGIGFDMHQLAEGRPLIIGGVTIPHEKGLDGHSDADVLVHAICDALLGAAGKGDIGQHFPDTDDQYKGISSLVLLKQVNEIIQDEGYQIVNLDVVIHAEAPKITPYKEKMCFNIAFELALDEGAINIKATTHEGLGPIGLKQGIAAQVIAGIVKRDH